MDRRRFPSNGRVALASLRGSVVADRFVDGEPRQVAVPELNLCRAPDGTLDKVMLFGEMVTVIENDEDFAFLQCDTDGYVGYASASGIAAQRQATHRVIARSSHVYPEPDIKTTPRVALSMGSRLAGVGTSESFLETADGFTPLTHLAQMDARTDSIETARRLIGTPYLWGGNAATGIDCSGLVQMCLALAGIPCPRDSDQQEAELGVALSPGQDLRAGDLIFWKGHVGMMADASTLIHANAFHMAVAMEPLEQAIDRIGRNEFGEVTSRKRVPLP